jgi:acetylglutamate kinase
MKQVDFRAKILTEALPYIKAYHGKTIVIKYGGGAMLSRKLQQSIASDIALMKYVGISPVVVHGGGGEISSFMKQLGLEVEFIGGLRKTNAQTMEAVKMVLVGKINKQLVNMINSHGNLAVGLSGDDGHLILARKKETAVDLGFVGEVEKINTKIANDLIDNGFIPVIASVGSDNQGQSYNINADTVAAAIATSLKANKLIFLTNVKGIYSNYRHKSSLLSKLNLKKCQQLLTNGQIEGGMIPKVEASIVAVKAGVEKAHILDGTTAHALLLEIFTNEGVGTMIYS